MVKNFREMKTRITIIILNYNNYNDTIECFESIDNSNADSYDIIIVDNKSTDNSYTKLFEYFKNKKNSFYEVNSLNPKEKIFETHNFNRKIILLETDYNGGYAYGNNQGIKRSNSMKSDFVLILNNDTIVTKNFLSPLVNTAQHNNAGIIGSKINYFSNQDTIWFNGGSINSFTSEVKHFDFNKVKYESSDIKTVSFITGCVWLVPKKIFKEIGLLDEEYFMYFEDVDFCWRVASNGYKLLVCTDSLIYHKKNPNKTNNFNLPPSIYYLRLKNKIKFVNKNFKIINKLSSYFYTLLRPIMVFMLKGRLDLVIKHIYFYFKIVFNYDSK